MNKEEAKKLIVSTVNSDIVIKYLSGDMASLETTKALKKILSVVDQIEPDHPNVKLPREVGAVVDKYRHYAWASMTDLLYWFHSTSTAKMPKAVACWVDNVEINKKQSILADAYRYGWEAEPEELFYVKVPEKWGTGLTFTWVTMKYGGFDLINKEDAQTFTRAQIKEYHLDSDIFTLVPAEE